MSPAGCAQRSPVKAWQAWAAPELSMWAGGEPRGGPGAEFAELAEIQTLTRGAEVCMCLRGHACE